jgi:TolA-binding protein
MKGDRLSEATRALRETVDGSCEDPQAAEDRMIALLPRTRRLRLVKPWGFSLAALLIGSSVWGASSGRLRPWLESLDLATPVTTSPAPPQVAAKKRAPPIAVHPPPATASEEPVLPPIEPAPRLAPPPLPLPRTNGETAPPTDALEPPPAVPSADGSSALDVYEQAHQLHFLQHDYARALTAWDRYLSLAPSGSLALEARFHRGICLVRLGQKQEAQRALEPFARGSYGTYRQAQAQKLLDEIGAATGP